MDMIFKPGRMVSLSSLARVMLKADMSVEIEPIYSDYCTVKACDFTESISGLLEIHKEGVYLEAVMELLEPTVFKSTKALEALMQWDNRDITECKFYGISKFEGMPPLPKDVFEMYYVKVADGAFEERVRRHKLSKG